MNEAEIKPADYLGDLCAANDGGPNSITYKDNTYCGQEAAVWKEYES